MENEAVDAFKQDERVVNNGELTHFETAQLEGEWEKLKYTYLLEIERTN